MCSPNRPQRGSSLYYSITICVLLLLVSPLIILSVLDCTFGPWSGKVCLLGTDSLALTYKEGESSKRASDNAQSFRTVIRNYTKLEKLEAAVAKARSLIKEAGKLKISTSVHKDQDYVPRGPIYRNANAFHRSYLEMEKLFKIYVYDEGEPPIFHDGPCMSIYSTEGRFIMELENWNHFRTKDPDHALVYFLPFSVTAMVKYLYVHGDDSTYLSIRRTCADYIDIISTKHPFWNRSLGADHFMLSCHDWGPYTTAYVPQLFNNSIRVLCNANITEGFNPAKDASLPEIYLRRSDILDSLGGSPASNRSVLAFFAGGVHGYQRYLLMEHWKGKDKDIKVYEKVPQNMSYKSMMQNSKYCLCPSGYEVASPRVVEAIYADCVPVLLSDGYIPPFSDVLNWDAFSVNVPMKDISKLKEILIGIPQSKYLELHEGVKAVRRHFLVNKTPERFDIFHMIIHSIWLRRLNVRIQD